MLKLNTNSLSFEMSSFSPSHYLSLTQICRNKAFGHRSACFSPFVLLLHVYLDRMVVTITEAAVLTAL